MGQDGKEASKEIGPYQDASHAVIPNPTARMRFPPEAWWQWGNEMLGRNYRSTSEQQWRRWRQSYGTASPLVMSEIWDRCAADVPNSRPEHMLWAIIFLKTYGTESDMCDKVRNPNRPDEKTFRHWAWKWIKAISTESSVIIEWENRNKDDVGNECRTSLDSFDSPIDEPSPFWKGWFSKKHGGAGLRYEVCVSLRGGDIVWFSGPWACGANAEITTFRRGLKQCLDEGECVESDRGLRGEACIKTPSTTNRNEIARSQANTARARQESAIGRIKIWRCVKIQFRHGIEKHADCARACAALAQLSIEHGEPLFEIDYYTAD